MGEVKNLSFLDFNRMLTENNGKPVYEEKEHSFIMEWTIGGFTYHTEVSKDTIYEIYKRQFGYDNKDAALKAFKRRFLQDAYSCLSDEQLIGSDEFSFMPQAEQTRVERPGFTFAKEKPIKDFVKGSLWAETSGMSYSVKGIVENTNEIAEVGSVRKKFKVLMVSAIGCGFGMAWQLKREGHDVLMYIKGTEKKEEKEIGNGLVDKTEDWEAHVHWADFIIFDDIRFGEDQDRLRKEGYLVVGGSGWGDKAEINREYANGIFREIGMKDTPSTNFTSFDEAINFVKSKPKRYVIKPLGVKAQDYKEQTYVGQKDDGSDMAELLSHFKTTWKGEVDFLLQEFVNGVEVAIGAYFNGTGWVMPYNINFEHKKFFTGDRGIQTGEMGTSMYFDSDRENKLWKYLEKITPYLKKSDYRGSIDINCIANEEGVYPLEFTSRFGYPAVYIEQEAIKTPMGEWLYKLANGTLKEFEMKHKWSLGVVLASAGFPYGKQVYVEKYKGLPIMGLDKTQSSHFYLSDVELKKGKIVLSGDYGYIGVVTGGGNTLAEAKRNAYIYLKPITVPDMFYRDDIGDRWYKDYPKLKDLGLVTMEISEAPQAALYVEKKAPVRKVKSGILRRVKPSGKATQYPVKVAAMQVR